MERQRLGKALDAQRQEDNTITLAAVADETARLQSEFDSEKHKMVRIMMLAFLIGNSNETLKN